MVDGRASRGPARLVHHPPLGPHQYWCTDLTRQPLSWGKIAKLGRVHKDRMVSGRPLPVHVISVEHGLHPSYFEFARRPSPGASGQTPCQSIVAGPVPRARTKDCSTPSAGTSASTRIGSYVSSSPLVVGNASALYA